MTAINHALTGATIGLVIGQPLLAIPLAFVSHFICDAIPHYRSKLSDKILLRSRGFRNYLVLDAMLCICLVAVLAITRPDNWQLASICAFIATSPDFAWFPRFVMTRRGQKWRPNSFDKFAANIQWFQRPIGSLVEVAWFVAGILVIAPFIA